MAPRPRLRASIIGVALVLAGTSLGTAPPAPVPPDVRGLWVPRGSLVTPEAVATLVTEARSAGITDLLVQVRGRGEAFYRSDLEPRSTELDGQPLDFDPLALTIDRAKAAGLRVHAWINVNLVASGTSLPRGRTHVVARHPEWLMVPRALASELSHVAPTSPGYLGALARWTRSEAVRVEGLYVSPVMPEARAYAASLLRELVQRYPLDGVHLDYLRYPSELFDYSTAALGAFRTSRLAATPMAERQRLDRAAQTDPTAWASALPADWAMFLRDRLTWLAAGLQAAAREARPGIVVSAAVVPSAAEARERRRQDWPVWARAGYFDVLCPMIYTTSADEFDAALGSLPAMLGGTPFWAGIGAFRLPIAGTIGHLQLARRSEAAGIVLFSYEKLADTGTSAASLTALRSALLANHAASPPRSPAR